METKHTPGPWETAATSTVDDCILWDVCGPGGGDMVADLSECGDEATQEANARLIAAAPDLLAALVSCLESLNVAQERAEGDLFGVHHNTAMDNMDAARAAIAKAKGAQP